MSDNIIKQDGINMKNSDKTKVQLLAEIEKLKQEVTSLKKAKDKIAESGSTIRRKQEEIMEPTGNLDSLSFLDTIDVEALKSLMEAFFKVTNIGSAILDASGKVLVAVGWQDICVKFHRVNPETLQKCHESDTILTTGVEMGAFKTYRCKNNMRDMATPIEVNGRIVGNIYIGQFFYDDETPDVELFRNQAKLYGFNEKEYLAALERVPRFNKEKLKDAMLFCSKLSEMISNLSYSTLKLARSINKLKVAEKKLREARELSDHIINDGPIAIVQADVNGQIIDANKHAIELLGLNKNKVSGMMFNAPNWHITDIDGGSYPEEKLAFSQVINTGEPVYNVQYAINLEGKTRQILSINGAPLHDEHGRVNRVILAIQDITKERKYISEIEKSKALLDATGKMARVGGWELNVNTKELIWTNGTYYIHEIPLDTKPPLADAINFFHPDDRPILEEALEESMKKGKPYDLELRFISAKGRNLVTRTICKPIFKNGKVISLQGTFQDITDLRNTEESLKRIQWLLSSKPKDEAERVYELPYGDVTELNTSRVILDGVGKKNLSNIAMQSVELLETSVAIYERNGDYAHGMFSSSWCKFMDKASRNLCGDVDNKKALNCGKWLCHEFCWNESAKVAMESGKATDVECVGGIHMYAVPIFVEKEVVGAINIGYGNPPTDDDKLKQLANDYQVELAELRNHAQQYEIRPQYIIDYAKSNLHRVAQLIGQIVSRSILEKELVMARKKAELADKAKSEFLSTMSHEIRTPLNGLLGFSEIIEDTLKQSKNYEQRDNVIEYLDIVKTCGHHLTELINDILELSSINAGKIDISFVDFSPEELLKENHNILEFKAKEKNISLNFEHKNLPSIAHGAKRRLKQILFNLVGNAIKFTEKGGVTVKADCKGGELLFEVKDTGIGISADMKKKILEPFTQVDQSNTRKYDGTGLGLTIVSKMLEMLVSKLKIESEFGKGTTMSFAIPVKIIKSSIPALEKPKKSAVLKTKSNFLIIEDDEISVLYLQETLKNSGAKYKVAGSYAEMQEICNNGFIPDIALIDISLPGKDGFECMKWLKNKFSDKEIKCIAQTAHVLEEDFKQYRDAGFDDFLGKPYKQEKIIELFNS